MIVNGTVAFSNLTKHEVFNGTSTGKYSLVIQPDEGSATELRNAGVKLKEYEGIPQRKFSSKFDTKVVDTENIPVFGELPRGSKVRVQCKLGNPHPVHGVTPYLQAVRVVEMAEGGLVEEGF